MAELLEKTQSSYFLAFKTIFRDVVSSRWNHVNIIKSYTVQHMMRLFIDIYQYIHMYIQYIYI